MEKFLGYITRRAKDTVGVVDTAQIFFPCICLQRYLGRCVHGSTAREGKADFFFFASVQPAPRGHRIRSSVSRGVSCDCASCSMARIRLLLTSPAFDRLKAQKGKERRRVGLPSGKTHFPTLREEKQEVLKCILCVFLKFLLLAKADNILRKQVQPPIQFFFRNCILKFGHHLSTVEVKQ